MTVELPASLDVSLPSAIPTLRSAYRTFRTFVCGASTATAFLLLASTAQGQEPQDPPSPAGWIGTREMIYGTSGAVVGSVRVGGPAQQAGIVVGDTIVSFNSMNATEDNFNKLMTPGNHITLNLRHNKVRTVTVVVESVAQTPATLPVIGKPAPQLVLQQWLNVPAGKTLGKTTTFGDGHVYVLDFTATWCEGCPRMYPIMEQLKQQYAAQGLRVIYVTALWGFGGEDAQAYDTPAQELTAISQYITKHQMTSPVAIFAKELQFVSSGYFDRLKVKNDGDLGYGASLPEVVLIDGAGNVRTKFEEEDAFMKEVASAVAASHPKTP